MATKPYLTTQTYSPTVGGVVYNVSVGLSASTNVNLATATLSEGTGSPEGVVTAPPGSVYLNKSGGSNASIYSKESGSGNTGWVALGSVMLTGYEDVTTGILTGGVVTINSGDSAKFDVSAGTGIIMDWTTPATPVRTEVTWSAFTAEDPLNLATGVFTTLGIDSNGDLIKRSGAVWNPVERRICIILQTVSHTSGTEIGTVSGTSQPSYDVTQSLLDYVTALGPINKGNKYTANGVNLKIDKASGTTTLPFINRVNDPHVPTVSTDSADTDVSSMTFAYQDGAGGTTFVGANTAIDPDFYDDGSGTLAAVSTNKWTVQRIYYFGQTASTAIVYGQVVYNLLADAEAAVFSETPIIGSLFSGATFITAIAVKEGTTDLSDTANNTFIDVASLLP